MIWVRRYVGVLAALVSVVVGMMMASATTLTFGFGWVVLVNGPVRNTGRAQ